MFIKPIEQWTINHMISNITTQADLAVTISVQKKWAIGHVWDGTLFRLPMLVALVLTLVFCGCSARTRISDRTYFPPGSDEKSAEYIVDVISDGALGKAYTEFSQKEVTVNVADNRKIEFSKKYNMTAGYLDWKVIWPEKGDVRIVFFDKDKPEPQNHVRTVHLILAPQFIEADN